MIDLKSFDYASRLTAEEKASIILYGQPSFFKLFKDIEMTGLCMPDGEHIDFRELVNRIIDEEAEL